MQKTYIGARFYPLLLKFINQLYTDRIDQIVQAAIDNDEIAVLAMDGRKRLEVTIGVENFSVRALGLGQSASAEFAAPKKKSCGATSISCGFTCIAAKKTCRIGMSLEQQREARELRRQIRAAKKETTQGRDTKVAKALAELDNAVEAFRPINAKYQELSDAIDSWSPGEKLADVVSRRKEQQEELAAIEKQWQDLEAVAIKAAQNLRVAITKLDQKQALALVEAANLRYLQHARGSSYRPMINATVSKRKKELAEIVQLTGEVPPTLKDILSKRGRAFATPEGHLMYNGSDPKSTQYHEFAHHMEFSDPELAAQAIAWRDKKAQSLQPVRLAILTGNDRYGTNEVAVPDSYIRPYVGKVYRQVNGVNSTEVTSVGLEHFAQPETMVSLRLNGRDHFDFMLDKVLKV